MVGRSVNPDDYQDIPCPLAVLAKDSPDNHTVSWHQHKRGQLLFASSGVLLVTTEKGSWVIPPRRAVWVPCGAKHETRTIGQVAMRIVFIASEAATNLPHECCVGNVSPLLRELILRAASFPLVYDQEGPEGRIMRLILDEISVSRALPLHLPMLSHPRLSNLCNALLQAPQRRNALQYYAQQAGMSTRTVERHFRRQIGMTFSEWYRQACLLTALTRLAEGRSVKQVAFEAGYISQSAFTHMFRQALGTTPSRYFSEPPQ